MVKDTYQSKDLMFSAALLAEGVPLFGARTDDGNSFVTFVFDDRKKCDDIEKQWWAGKLKVNAQHYADSVKRLKNLIHSRSTLSKKYD